MILRAINVFCQRKINRRLKNKEKREKVIQNKEISDFFLLIPALQFKKKGEFV